MGGFNARFAQLRIVERSRNVVCESESKICGWRIPRRRTARGYDPTRAREGSQMNLLAIVRGDLQSRC